MQRESTIRSLFRSAIFNGITLISGLNICINSGYSGECLPNDPLGNNEGNLCLTYPSHGLSIVGDSFRNGFASEGYYGTPIGPKYPGVPLNKNHVPGMPYDPRPSQNGFWRSIEAADGITRIRTDNGKTWIMKPE